MRIGGNFVPAETGSWCQDAPMARAHRAHRSISLDSARFQASRAEREAEARARLAKARTFTKGQLVTNGHETATVSSINENTGALYVRLAGSRKQVKWNPEVVTLVISGK